MSGDLPVILLLLGATIVPWLLWMFAAGRPDGQPGVTTPVPPAVTSAAVAEDDQLGLPGLQVRPDGVVLDWRTEAAIPRTQGSDGTLADASAHH